MKLIRFGPRGQERPGLFTDGRYLDASGVVGDYDPGFLADDAGVSALDAALASGRLPAVTPERLGPPVAGTGKIVCVGLNYARHAAESGMAPPDEPVLFFKAASAISGPNDAIVLPRGSEKVDWEVELAVVIGRRASYVTEAEALGHVAGYCLHNDVSERAYQLERGGQWVKGKSCDTFAPLGPYLVTADEVPDPQALGLWLEVNGERLQESSTSDMIFSVAACVSYVSQFMTLLPGDIISTGTPEGVGLGLTPPRYLRPGDRVRLGIDGLGVAEQEVVPYSRRADKTRP